MSLWLLLLLIAVPGVLTTGEQSEISITPSEAVEIDLTLTSLKPYVEDCKIMAKQLVGLYASPYAYGHLMAQLNSVQSRFDHLQSVYVERKISMDEMKKGLVAIEATARCATAEVFLLQIKSPSNSDYKDAIKCLGAYTTFSLPWQHQYENYVDSNDTPKADIMLHKMFTSGRKHYVPNACAEIRKIARLSYEKNDALLLQSVINYVNRLDHDLANRAIAVGIWHSTPESQYGIDLAGFDSHVKAITVGSYAVVDYKQLQKIFNVTTFHAKMIAEDHVGECEKAQKRLEADQKTIDGVQRQFMVFASYKQINSNIDNTEQLKQMQCEYEKLFKSQMRMIRGDLVESLNWQYDSELDDALNILSTGFVKSVQNEGLTALNRYLAGLNKLGYETVSQMPMSPRFTKTPKEPLYLCAKFNSRNRDERSKAFLLRYIYPDVSFLRKSPMRLRYSVLGKWHSREELDAYIEKESNAILARSEIKQITDCSELDEALFTAANDVKREIKNRGQHRVYYYVDITTVLQFNSDFYHKEYKRAHQQLLAKAEHTEWRIEMHKDDCTTFKCICEYIVDLTSSLCVNDIMSLHEYRRAMAMIQFVDEYTEPLSAGLRADASAGSYAIQIGDYIMHALNKYAETLHRQLDTASHLSIEEVDRLRPMVTINETSVRNKVRRAIDSHKKRNEAICQQIFGEIVNYYQSKMSAQISMMVYAPIVLDGTAYLTDIIVIFHNNVDLERHVVILVMKHLEKVVRAAQTFYESAFMPNEMARFSDVAHHLIERIYKEIIKRDADIILDGFEFQMKLDAEIRQFYSDFVNLIRSLTDETEFKARIYSEMDRMVDWLIRDENASVTKIVEEFVKPLEKRVKHQLNNIMKDCAAAKVGDSVVVQYELRVNAKNHSFESAKNMRFVDTKKHLSVTHLGDTLRPMVAEIRASFLQEIKNYIDARVDPLFRIIEDEQKHKACVVSNSKNPIKRITKLWCIPLC